MIRHEEEHQHRQAQETVQQHLPGRPTLLSGHSEIPGQEKLVRLLVTPSITW
jgi:hypothetical protein